MDDVKVLQVVGFKNSGKTTLITKLLDVAKRRGKTVSTIKHHGHGGLLETPSATTDSMQFFDHGAQSSLAYGGGVIQLHMQTNEASLDDLIKLSMQAKPDIILIEGFKDAAHEKIAIVRSSEDWEDLQRLDNVLLVITHEGVQLNGTEVFERSRMNEMDQWFVKWME